MTLSFSRKQQLIQIRLLMRYTAVCVEEREQEKERKEEKTDQTVYLAVTQWP